MRNRAVLIDDEQACVRRPLHRVASGDHAVLLDQRSRDGIGELARGRLGPLERRGIGVGHGKRMQRRVHVARIERQEAHALASKLLAPDGAHVPQRRFRRPVGAPLRIGVDRRVARYVEHHRTAAFAG